LAAGGFQSGHGPSVDQVTLEFGEGGHDGEEELAFPGGGVDAGEGAGQHPQRDALLVQVGN
jgi:hypothetical protein